MAAETWVIKLGGAVLESAEDTAALARDVGQLRSQGVQLLLVHGGGPQISALARQLGVEPAFAGGLRITDPRTMEITEMVLRGKMAPRLLEALLRQQVPAVAVSGRDAGLIRARYHPPVQGPSGPVDLGRVGEVEAVDPRLLWVLLGAGYLPIVTPVGAGPEGEALNLNADLAAAALAVALPAQRLYLLTDVPGVKGGEGAVVRELTREAAQALEERGLLQGGMLPKVRAGLWAKERGVAEVAILSGRTGELVQEIASGGGTRLVLEGMA